jgi:hypothetical protein
VWKEHAQTILNASNSKPPGRSLRWGLIAFGRYLRTWNNLFILFGPVPDEAAAVALAQHRSIIQIGEMNSSIWGQWQIRSSEFRENLKWAVIVPADRDVSPGVSELLTELSARGVAIRRLASGCW